MFAHAIMKHRNASLALIAVAVEGVVYLSLNTFYGMQSGAIYDGRLFYVGLRFSVFIFAVRFVHSTRYSRNLDLSQAMMGSVIWMYVAYRFRRVNEQLMCAAARWFF